MTAAKEGPPQGSGAKNPAHGAAVPARRGGGRLDRHRILVAAADLVEREGLSALTMRHLGAELGVEAMALYRYLPGRESLIDGIVELVVDELYADPDVLLMPEHGWQDYVTRLAHGVRRMALARPALFPLVATRPPAAPWVRPPLRSLRWIESFLTALSSQGFSDHQAVEAYRAITSFLLGHLLLEVAALGVDISPADGEHVDEARADPLDDYPNLARLAPLLTSDDSETEFAESLTNLLRRLAGTSPSS